MIGESNGEKGGTTITEQLKKVMMEKKLELKNLKELLFSESAYDPLHRISVDSFGHQVNR